MLCVLWVDSIIPSKTILVTIEASFCRSVVHAGPAGTWWSWDIMRPSCCRCLIMKSSCTTAACCCCFFSFFCNCTAWRSSTCRWRLDSWPKKKLEKKEATRWKSLSKKKIFSFNLSLIKPEVCSTVFQQLAGSKLQRRCTTAAPPVVPARSASWCSPCAAAAAGSELVTPLRTIQFLATALRDPIHLKEFIIEFEEAPSISPSPEKLGLFSFSIAKWNGRDEDEDKNCKSRKHTTKDDVMISGPRRLRLQPILLGAK